MKTHLLFIAFSLCFLLVKAQTKHEKIESAKIAYLTKEMNLTPMEAEDFWPLYNQYSKERKQLRREQRTIQQESLSLSENDVRIIQNMERIEALKLKEVELDKSYRKRFLIIISPQQLLTLYQAERDFFKMLKDRITETD